MFGLPIEVRDDPTDHRLTHRKGSVAILPMKCSEVQRTIFHPFRGLALQRLHQVGNRDRARQPAQDVNVIAPTADPGRRTRRLLGVVAEHPKHFLAEVGTLKVHAAFPRAEYEMHPNACERLRHGRDPFLGDNKKNDWPVGPAGLTHGAIIPQGVALGWKNHRPLGAKTITELVCQNPSGSVISGSYFSAGPYGS
jgi:hypothetical protein